MTAKEKFLETFDREFATTVKVLRAYPKEKADMKPAPHMKSARELAWTFVAERYLSLKVWNDEFAKGFPTGGPPPQKPPESIDEIIGALEKVNQEYRKIIASAPDDELTKKIHFFTAPKTLGEVSRLDWIWFLLHDEIHHRGQFSIYARLAGGKLPSIYGPTADEPWN